MEVGGVDEWGKARWDCADLIVGRMKGGREERKQL